MIHIQSTFSTNVATFHQIRINGQKIKLILNHSDRKLHQITLDFYPITVSSSLFHKGIIPLPFIDNETASLQLPCKKANKLNSDTFSSCLSYVYLCIYISYFKLHFLFFSIHHIIFHSNFFDVYILSQVVSTVALLFLLSLYLLSHSPYLYQEDKTNDINL